MRLLDVRIQAFFWSALAPADRGDAFARSLVDCLDDAAVALGCLPEELWVLRGVLVLGADPYERHGPRSARLAHALPSAPVEDVLAVLQDCGHVSRRPFDDGGFQVAPLGRELLREHQNQEEPAAAAMRFLRRSADDDTLGPWDHRGQSAHRARTRRTRVDRRATRSATFEPNHYLKAHREAAGFGQAELGAEIGAAERTIGRLETGEVQGSIRTFALVSKPLHCLVDDLLPNSLRRTPLPRARLRWLLPPL